MKIPDFVPKFNKANQEELVQDGPVLSDTKPPIYKRKWFIVVAVIVLLAMVSTCSRGGGSSSESSSTQSADSVTLTAKTQYLEYSNKEVDPLTLVEGDNKSAEITTESKIDLTKVGTQKVVYEIKLGDSTAQQEIEFQVRDTKAPTINAVSSSPTVDQGADFDARALVKSATDEVDGDLTYVESAPEAKGSDPGNEVFYDEGWYTIDGELDPSTPATYSFIVTASDKHGNVTTKEIGVKVLAAPTPEPAEEAASSAPAAATTSYVLNTSTMKFHVPSCRDVKKIKDSNRVDVTATRDEITAQGYSPCGHCNP